MTTNNDEIVCECGHGVHKKVCRKEIEYQGLPMICPCNRFTDARIAALRAQLAQAQERVRELEQCLISSSEQVADHGEAVDALRHQLAQRDAEIARLREELVRMLNLTRGLFPDSTFDTAREAIKAAGEN